MQPKEAFAMPRFLVEVPHEADTLQCARIIKAFLSSGNHFLTHADWGCQDGVHTGWIVMDVDTKEQALSILPATVRSRARVVALNSFTIDQIDSVLAGHGS